MQQKSTHSALIKNYMQGWLSQDKKLILDSIHPEAVIEECYGPRYTGLAEITLWLDKWFAKGIVETWEILDEWYDFERETYFYKWYFRCNVRGEESEFNGMSLMQMQDGLLIKLEEFQTTVEHHFPY